MFQELISRIGRLSRGWPWSIRYKVLGLVVLAAVLPTALVGSTSYWYARSTLTEKLLDQLNAQASLTAAKVSEWFQERQRDTQIFADSGIVTSNLMKGRAGDAPSDELVDAYLKEVSGRYGLYRTLAVVDESGRLVAAAGRRAAEDVTRVSSLAIEAGAEIEWTEEGALLWLSRPVLAGAGRIGGHFLLVCDFENLREAIVIRETLQRLRLSAASGRIVLAHPDESGGVAGLEERNVAGGEVVSAHDVRGVAVLAASRRIDGPAFGEPLELTVTIDRDVAFASVTELRGKILLLSALAVLLVVVLAYGLVASLIDPLERLAAGARAVTEGDYETRVPVRASDEIGYLTEVFNRMTSTLKANHERLQRLSTTDELTQLGNRRELQNALAEELSRAEGTGKPMSVIMIDIDHFKAFNDRFGHPGGDELLRRIGAYLLSSIPKTALAARYGGEEFLVILPETTLEEATKKAEALRVGFSNEEGAGGVTLSMGVASREQDGVSAAELIAAADRALYQAKDLGRDRVVAASMAKATKSESRKRKASPTVA